MCWLVFYLGKEMKFCRICTYVYEWLLLFCCFAYGLLFSICSIKLHSLQSIIFLNNLISIRLRLPAWPKSSRLCTFIHIFVFSICNRGIFLSAGVWGQWLVSGPELLQGLELFGCTQQSNFRWDMSETPALSELSDRKFTKWVN